MAELAMIEIEKANKSRIDQIDFDNIPFGKTFSDHIFVAEYYDGAWQTARIKPYGPISLSPATSALHYGQSIFEGMKAHRTADGRIALFRPEQNARRFNQSAVRMAMPEVPEELFMEGIRELIKLDADWVPNKEGSSLYIRPLMFGTEPYIGVRTSDRYLFILMTGPAGPYYSTPVSILVNEEFARAVKGGVGHVKTAGNYGRTLHIVDDARSKGYNDVLWLDGAEKKYVEEIGTMNIFFVIDDKVVTPKLDGTFLEGITRKSVLKIASDLGYETEERRLPMTEIAELHDAGRLTEMFGTGTAATITKVNKFCFRGKDHNLNADHFPIAERLKTELEGIKLNSVEDRYNWLQFIS